MSFETIPLESSSLHEIKYDSETGALRVIFKTQAEYEYEAVPPEIAQYLRESPSPGTSYRRLVQGQYKSTKIRDAQPKAKKAKDDAKVNLQELPTADSASRQLPVDAHEGQPVREAGTDTEPATVVESEALAVVTEARQLQVTNPDEYRVAAEELRTIAQHVQRIRDWFAPLKQKAHEAHKAICEREKQSLEQLITVEQWIKQQLGTYKLREEQARIAEQNRLQAERDAEAREKARREADDAQLSLAEELHAAGDHDAAEAVLCEDVQPAPTFVAPVILPTAVPQVEGIGGRTVWKFRITDPTKVPREFLMVDEAKIGGVVRAMKDMTRIPGIEVYPEQVVSARRKA